MHRKYLRHLSAMMLLISLYGCGGGGGGSDGPPAPQDQTISFATAGPVSGAAGTTVTNVASGGAGTGAITYSSNNISVASVNATTGVVTLNAVGTATITAIKSTSSGFNQATASYTLNVTPGTQTIVFSQLGPLEILKGLSVTNTASGGAGTGAITYSSANPSVATVGATSGLVAGISAGTTTITATKAADTNYSQAQTTYTVNVQTQAMMSAWVGASNTLVSLPSAASGGQFIRSRDRNCNFNNFALCTNGQSDIFTSGTVSDTAATTTTAGYYVLRGSAVTTNVAPVSVQKFSDRLGHAAVYFNNRYWVIGGAFHIASEAKNDVWSSVDGKTWELETANAAFSARWLHQALVYNNKIWIFGGQNSSGTDLSDVWSSTDGVNWTFVTSSPTFLSYTLGVKAAVFNGAMWVVSAGAAYSSTDGANWMMRSTAGAVDGARYRADATLTSYNGALYYIGGVPNYSGQTPAGNSVSDVWKSTDGVAWTRITANAPFASRWRHAAFVINNRLWIFGGNAVVGGVVTGPTPDAWSTTDGTTWTLEAQSSTLARSVLTAIVQEPSKVTLIGGSIRSINNHVWQTTDGRQWTSLSPLAAFSPRALPNVVAFLGDIWVIGGSTSEDGKSNEVWRSSDGISWTRVQVVGNVFSARVGHQIEVFNNRIWVIGGWDDIVGAGGTETRFNDVWSSADGINWTKHSPSGAIFSPRTGLRSAVFNSKMWIVGGNTATNVYANDVWSTTDGVTWIQETASANFSGRSAHTLTVFNNALWLIGGQNSATALGEIWKSTDGISWSLVAPIGSVFGARSGHAVTAYNNRLWLTSGWTGVDWSSALGGAADYYVASRFNDVWSSSDGINWRQDSSAAAFDKRVYSGLVSHNNELWLIGGLNYGRFNDVWRSTDGINWRVGYQQTITTP